MHFPFVSVIIPTYNRHNIICDTVNHLLKQDYPNYEIVVIDQTEHVPESIIDFFDNLGDKKVRYIHIDEPGLPNARNVGIKVAKGDIILFVDDDITPFNERLIRAHAQNYCDPNIMGVSGRVDDPKVSKKNDPKRILKITMWGTVTGGANGTVRTQIDTLYGCNMSFRRKDAIRVGMFKNYIIGSAHYEDLDFAFRLRKYSQKSLIFDPKAALFHHGKSYGGCGSRSMSALRRHVWRFHNMTVICLLNKDLINPLLFALGRLWAMLRISFTQRSIKPVFCLSYAIYLGYKTYIKGKGDF